MQTLLPLRSLQRERKQIEREADRGGDTDTQIATFREASKAYSSAVCLQNHLRGPD